MKRLITVIILFTVISCSVNALALTDAQRAEQRRQQQAAQRAYQESANTYNEVSTTASTYKEGAEIVRDSVKQVTPPRYRGWSDEE